MLIAFPPLVNYIIGSTPLLRSRPTTGTALLTLLHNNSDYSSGIRGDTVAGLPLARRAGLRLDLHAHALRSGRVRWPVRRPPFLSIHT